MISLSLLRPSFVSTEGIKFMITRKQHQASRINAAIDYLQVYELELDLWHMVFLGPLLSKASIKLAFILGTQWS